MEEYIVKTYPAELTRTKKRSYLDDFLEKQLERFRETAEKNPDLFKEAESFPSEERIRKLINRFLGEAGNKYVKKAVCDLVYALTLESPGCYRTEPDFKIYSPEQFHKQLRNWFIAPKFFKERLEELGFNKGFSNEAKNFVVNAYNVIYDAYLKETVKKDIERRNSLDSNYLL